MKIYTYTFSLLILAAVITNNPFYPPTQFYLPKLFVTEPRLSTNLLTSIDLLISHGTAGSAYNNHHHLVPLFDIYGQQLINTCPHESTPCYLPFSIDASFKCTQLLFVLTQNFTNGFYGMISLPLRHLKISSILFNSSNQQLLFQTLDQLAQEIGLNRKKVHPTGLSDMLFSIGNTYSILHDPFFDFIDIGIQISLLVPSGNTKKEHELFSLPLGFDGHWGIPCMLNIALGAYEWITTGCSCDLLIFIPHHKLQFIRTDPEQSTLILTTQSSTMVHKRPQFSVGPYIKADHVSRGLSLMAGYSFTYQGSTHLSLDISAHEQAIANNDPRLASWYMHTIHFAIEYDFTTSFDALGPRISLFYDRPVSGRNIFLTSMWTGAAGIDINWQF